MIQNIGNSYTGVVVQLDNNSFSDCRFDGCRMVYSGLGPVSLQGCSFSNVSWEFAGGAQNTISFLSGIYNGMGEGGRVLVENTFAAIRGGNLQPALTKSSESKVMQVPNDGQIR